MRTSQFFTLCVLTIVSVLFSSMAFTQQVFSPENENWKFDNDQVGIERIAGRTAIKIRSGKAMLEGVSFENGLIEFDMYMSGERAFAYLFFRGESDQAYEVIYLRTHKSGAPDAVQYAPVFQRRSAWQLYYDETGSAAARFPAKEWVPIKVELNGQKMKVWIGDDSKPALDIKELGRKPNSGWLAFRGFVPSTSLANYSAYFSNLKITPLDKVKNNTTPDSLPEGQITQWQVSPAFNSAAGPISAVPNGLRDNTWTTPVMQSNGVFEFLRSRTIPKGSRHWSVVAEVNLHSPQTQTCEVHFGFSDEITLSVNEQLILYNDSSYTYVNSRQQGIMHPDQIVAYLPLKQGDNLVRAVVSDRFGGWGLSANLKTCKDVIALPVGDI